VDAYHHSSRLSDVTLKRHLLARAASPSVFLVSSTLLVWNAYLTLIYKRCNSSRGAVDSPALFAQFVTLDSEAVFGSHPACAGEWERKRLSFPSSIFPVSFLFFFHLIDRLQFLFVLSFFYHAPSSSFYFFVHSFIHLLYRSSSAFPIVPPWTGETDTARDLSLMCRLASG